VLLGIGADGHTASLFPGTSALNVRDVGYVDNYVPQLGVPRLTATFGLLAETDEVIFLVAGDAKASMIASISAGASVPAARVTAQKQVLWLLDEPAASEL
jgi:6-phosphogluconolactonase/glucosamine-6-phosphate isomerase/deaminase